MHGMAVGSDTLLSAASYLLSLMLDCSVEVLSLFSPLQHQLARCIDDCNAILIGSFAENAIVCSHSLVLNVVSCVIICQSTFSEMKRYVAASINFILVTFVFVLPHDIIYHML